MRVQRAPEHPYTGASLITPESTARYVQGAPAESGQFEFFIGSWDCAVSIHGPSGEVSLELRGRWEARWTHERRLLVDDLSLFLPDGTEVLGWVNLRTFCQETGCWEISGQRALAPTAPTRTTGRWIDGQMHLSFQTMDPSGRLENRVRFHEISDDGWSWHWDCRAAGAAEEVAWCRLTTIQARRSCDSAKAR